MYIICNKLEAFIAGAICVTVIAVVLGLSGAAVTMAYKNRASTRIETPSDIEAHNKNCGASPLAGLGMGMLLGK